MFGQSTTELTGREHLRIDALRDAIQANRIHFPEPVPVFPREFRPDIQWRLVELYFIRGWSTQSLAGRYGITKRRVQQSLLRWAARAMESGYLLEIPTQAMGGQAVAPPRTSTPVPAGVPNYVPLQTPAMPAYAAHPA